MSARPDLGQLDTEAIAEGGAALDALDIADIARLMAAGDRAVPAAVEHALPAIVPAIEAAAERMQRGGRLFYLGAGTPGRLAVLDASECPPTFGVSADTVVAIIAGGRGAVFDAVEGAEDDHAQGAADVASAGVSDRDTVVGVSASGRTPYVIGGLARAREAGALTVGLACSRDSELRGVTDHAIEVLVGPELIAGSTRLKAGTAQKLVLNMFSTIVMIRMGKTYGNLMVDVRASNVKLRERAIRIVRAVTDADEAAARAALVSANWNAKLAIVLLLTGDSVPQAERRLATASGHLRVALAEGTHE